MIKLSCPEAGTITAVETATPLVISVIQCSVLIFSALDLLIILGSNFAKPEQTSQVFASERSVIGIFFVNRRRCQVSSILYT